MNDTKMIEPEIAKLLAMEGIDSRFTLCSVVSKRAKQLTDAVHFAEKDCKEVIQDKGVSLALDHDKPVTSAVWELYEGKLDFVKTEE